MLYGSGRDGWMAADPAGPKKDLVALFDLVVRHVPPPTVEDGPFRLLATTLEADPYLGRLLTGRISSGEIRPNQTIKALRRDGSLIETARVTKVLAFRGLERTAVDLAEAGDIVAIAGISQATVADTLCDPTVEKAFAGAADRSAHARHDVPHQRRTVRRPGGRPGAEPRDPRAPAEGGGAQRGDPRVRARRQGFFEVAGRGELQLGILIETMRREGFELTVSRPQVLFKTDPATGGRLEPVEEVIIDVDEEHAGIVVQKLSERRGDLMEMRSSGGGRQRLVLLVPTRGLIGYQGELLTDTRGTAVMNRLFHSYVPYKGEIAGRRTGVLISNATGEATAYSLFYLQERGAMMIDPQTRVYAGMIIGQHTRDNDLVVNIIQGKKLSNVRAAGKDENMVLTPPMRLTLERALSYIEDDELVEITPKSIRLRKRWLDPNERKRRERAREAGRRVTGPVAQSGRRNAKRRAGARLSCFAGCARLLPEVQAQADADLVVPDVADCHLAGLRRWLRMRRDGGALQVESAVVHVERPLVVEGERRTSHQRSSETNACFLAGPGLEEWRRRCRRSSGACGSGRCRRSRHRRRCRA